MGNEIIWGNSLKEGLKVSKREGKPLLIDFFNPN
jgi:hypothetical protein